MTGMRLVSALALCAAVASAAVMGGGAADDMKPKAKVGEAAPAFTLTDINGKEHKLSDYAGKLVVLEWVNPQCPVCRGAHQDKRIPNMIEELREQDVVFLGINSSHFTDAQENEKALKGYGVEYPVLLDTDGKVGRTYGARTTPHLFVIDTKGVLRYQGALDDDRTAAKTKAGEPVTNYALNAVSQINAGETVAPDTARPYGCSVKYKNQ